MSNNNNNECSQTNTTIINQPNEEEIHKTDNNQRHEDYIKYHHLSLASTTSTISPTANNNRSYGEKSVGNTQSFGIDQRNSGTKSVPVRRIQFESETKNPNNDSVEQPTTDNNTTSTYHHRATLQESVLNDTKSDYHDKFISTPWSQLEDENSIFSTNDHHTMSSQPISPVRSLNNISSLEESSNISQVLCEIYPDVNSLPLLSSYNPMSEFETSLGKDSGEYEMIVECEVDVSFLNEKTEDISDNNLEFKITDFDQYVLFLICRYLTPEDVRCLLSEDHNDEFSIVDSHHLRPLSEVNKFGSQFLFNLSAYHFGSVLTDNVFTSQITTKLDSSDIYHLVGKSASFRPKEGQNERGKHHKEIEKTCKEIDESEENMTVYKKIFNESFQCLNFLFNSVQMKDRIILRGHCESNLPIFKTARIELDRVPSCFISGEFFEQKEFVHGMRLRLLETDGDDGTLVDTIPTKVYVESLSLFILDNLGNLYSYGRPEYGVLGRADLQETPICDDFDKQYRPFSHTRSKTVRYSDVADHPVLFSIDPIPVAVPHRIISFSVGEQHCLAIDSFGQVWSWGVGDFGCLGQNDKYRDHLTPRRIPAFSKTVIVSAHAANVHSIALDNTGQVWGWGTLSGSNLHGVPLPRVNYYSDVRRSDRPRKMDHYFAFDKQVTVRMIAAQYDWSIFVLSSWEIVVGGSCLPDGVVTISRSEISSYGNVDLWPISQIVIGPSTLGYIVSSTGDFYIFGQNFYFKDFLLENLNFSSLAPVHLGLNITEDESGSNQPALYQRVTRQKIHNQVNVDPKTRSIIRDKMSIYYRDPSIENAFDPVSILFRRSVTDASIGASHIMYTSDINNLANFFNEEGEEYNLNNSIYTLGASEYGKLARGYLDPPIVEEEEEEMTQSIYTRYRGRLSGRNKKSIDYVDLKVGDYLGEITSTYGGVSFSLGRKNSAFVCY